MTAEADAHIGRSFAADLDAASLKGARIGVFRQRFVGVTGEREVAAAMERVVGELRRRAQQWSTSRLPTTTPSIARARQRAGIAESRVDRLPLARREARRTRVDDRGAGRVGQDGAGRAASPRGRIAAHAAGAGSRRGDWAVRCRPRIVPAALRRFMDQQRLDAMLYPANQARPQTHEGGLERYGSEPGTCEESAATGLPQVTVPAGFMGGRYPVGVSLLGRMWADGRLLAWHTPTSGDAASASASDRQVTSGTDAAAASPQSVRAGGTGGWGSAHPRCLSNAPRLELRACTRPLGERCVSVILPRPRP